MKRITAISLVIICLMIFTGCNSPDPLIIPTPDSPNSTPSESPNDFSFSEDNDSDSKINMPEDFDFRIEYGVGGINCIDTYNNTFTKDLVQKGTKTIDFLIPDDVMQKIYKIFVDNDITELPDDINADVEVTDDKAFDSWTPANSYSLTYTCNNETRTIVCEDGGPWHSDTGPPACRNNLVLFVSWVNAYICSTKEYQRMPNADGGYV